MKKKAFITMGGMLMMTMLLPISAAAKGTDDKMISFQVKTDYKGKKGALSLDAKVEEDMSDWKTGTLEREAVPVEKLKELYSVSENWMKIELPEEPESWRYGELPIYASSSEGEIIYDNETFQKELQEDTTKDKNVYTENKAWEMGEDILDKIGISANIIGLKKNKQVQIPGAYYPFCLVGTLDGKEVAVLTEGNETRRTNLGHLEFLDGELMTLDFFCNFKIKKEEKAELLDFEDILDMTEMMAKQGLLAPTAEGQKITEIKLQYYVKWKKDTIEFCPVWVFFVSVRENQGLLGTGTEGYFYIDAQTGELLQYQENLTAS